LVEELVDAHVGSIRAIEEIDDDDIVFLPVTMAATNALLNSLRVPRQVIVDHEIAELEVDTLCGCFCCNHDAGFVAEVLDERGALIRGGRAGRAIGFGIAKEPLAVDIAAFLIAVGSVEQDHPSSEVGGFKQSVKVLLCATRFGKDDCLLLKHTVLLAGSRFVRGLESLAKRCKEDFSFRVPLNALG
jgi:hypothetical protein